MHRDIEFINFDWQTGTTSSHLIPQVWKEARVGGCSCAMTSLPFFQLLCG